MTKDISKTKFPIAILKQMITLATSGFGVVAALAWNSVIQDLVTNHIKPYLPAGSSLLSLFIYAVTVTVLAVTVTYYLSKLISRFEAKEESELDAKANTKKKK